MKILYIENVASIDAVNFYYTAAEAAKELNFEFHLAYNAIDRSSSKISKLKEENSVIFHQIDFIRFPFHPFNIIAFFQMVRLIKEEQIEIIHCNTPIGGIIGRLAGKFCKVKTIIYQAHGFHFFKGSGLLNWIVFFPVELLLSFFTDIFITINKEDYEFAKKFLCWRKQEIFFINGVGVNINEINAQIQGISKNKLRRKFNFDTKDILLVSVGELNNNKNQIIVIKALKEIMNNDNTQKIHYVICGTGKNETMLKKRVKAYNLEKNVHFLGYRKDIIQILKMSDIFLLPSFREGLSRSLMEALTISLPCIASNIRGNNDLIDQNLGGFLCNPSDFDEFYYSILKLTDENIRKKMGEYNTHKIKNYDISVVKNSMKKIYRKLI